MYDIKKIFGILHLSVYKSLSGSLSGSGSNCSDFDPDPDSDPKSVNYFPSKMKDVKYFNEPVTDRIQNGSEEVAMPEITLTVADETKAAEALMDAVQTEAKRLKYGLELSRKRMAAFENKYNVTSSIFASSWAAEDLDGNDLEYIEWAGEYELALRLAERLTIIDSIQYATH